MFHYSNNFCHGKSCGGPVLKHLKRVGSGEVVGWWVSNGELTVIKHLAIVGVKWFCACHVLWLWIALWPHTFVSLSSSLSSPPVCSLLVSNSRMKLPINLYVQDWVMPCHLWTGFIKRGHLVFNLNLWLKIAVEALCRGSVAAIT